MTLRDWVKRQLGANSDQPVRNIQNITNEGDNGLIIERSNFPASRVFIANPERGEFTPHSLRRALAEMPSLEFVLVIQCLVANETYNFADSHGIVVGGLNHLRSAIRSERNIGLYRTRDRQFIESRLRGHRLVSSFERRGKDAYGIERNSPGGTLLVAMTDKYEFTVEEFYRHIELYDDLNLDALVCTNPNCSGFSTALKKAAEESGMQVLLMSEFLAPDGPLSQ